MFDKVISRRFLVTDLKPCFLSVACVAEANLTQLGITVRIQVSDPTSNIFFLFNTPFRVITNYVVKLLETREGIKNCSTYYNLCGNSHNLHKPFSSLRKKCPNTEFFLVRIFPQSVQARENTDQKKLHIWSSFVQCILLIFGKIC